MWDFPIILTQGGPDMKRKRYSEEQIISILKEHEAGATDFPGKPLNHQECHGRCRALPEA